MSCEMRNAYDADGLRVALTNWRHDNPCSRLASWCWNRCIDQVARLGRRPAHDLAAALRRRGWVAWWTEASRLAPLLYNLAAGLFSARFRETMDP